MLVEGRNQLVHLFGVNQRCPLVAYGGSIEEAACNALYIQHNRRACGELLNLGNEGINFLCGNGHRVLGVFRGGQIGLRDEKAVHLQKLRVVCRVFVTVDDFHLGRRVCRHG